MANVKTFEITVAVEVDLDDYATEYGMTPAEAETDAQNHIVEQVGELVEAKGEQMGYYTAHVRAFDAQLGDVVAEAPSDDPYCGEHGHRFDPAVGCPACLVH